MVNDFGCKHSDRVQEFFKIESRGIDYINDFEVFFEFKESWAKERTQMFFKVPKIQLLNSDFIVFLVHDEEFYIHGAKRILRKYPFDNKYKHCCLRYTTIKKNYIAKFDNYCDLKDFIDNRSCL